MRHRVPALIGALAISASCGVALASANRHVSAHGGPVFATHYLRQWGYER